MNIIILIIIILIIIIIFYSFDKYLKKNNFEKFQNYKNDEKIIWMYWETMPGKKKPGYIDLCMNSVKFNCGNCFKIIIIENITILKYIPEIQNMNLSNLN